MTPTLRFLAPTLVLSAFAFALIGLDAVKGGSLARRSRAELWIALIGVLGAALLIPCTGLDQSIVYGRGILVFDGLSFTLSLIALITTFLVIVISEEDSAFGGNSLALYYGLLLLSAIGLIFVVSANDFLMIFLAIELVGIPAFILAAYHKRTAKSVEAGIKFFLIGAFSSAMLAYGISLLYGLTGSTSLSILLESSALLKEKTTITMLAIFFILVSFGFKIALVPFHMWVPDVFEGAPTPIAAYLSVAPKIAGAALSLRVFNLVLPSADLGVLQILAILSVLTMTIANVVGLQQTNVIRLLAYSSIAHMGYLFLGLIAGGPLGISSVYLYGWIYLFMNLGAFAVVVCLSNALQSNEISAYAGLAKRAPALSALLVLFLLSLAGMPPTAGFIAKFYVFSAAYNSGWTWLVVAGAVNSVIAVGYYFKILHSMYFKTAASDTPVLLPLPTRMVLGLTSFVTLFLGLAPQIGFTKIEKLITRPAVTAEIPQPAVTPDSSQP